MDNKEYLKTLGLNIKLARTIRGYSQDDIAGMLDIDKSYFSKIERGLANPTITYLRELAKYLRMDLTELVDINFDSRKLRNLQD